MKIFIGAIIVYFLVVFLVGVHCAQYVLWAVTGQDISILGDVLLAMFFSTFFVPAAVLLWVAGMLGLVYPLIN